MSKEYYYTARDVSNEREKKRQSDLAKKAAEHKYKKQQNQQRNEQFAANKRATQEATNAEQQAANAQANWIKKWEKAIEDFYKVPLTPINNNKPEDIHEAACISWYTGNDMESLKKGLLPLKKELIIVDLKELHKQCLNNNPDIIIKLVRDRYVEILKANMNSGYVKENPLAGGRSTVAVIDQKFADWLLEHHKISVNNINANFPITYKNLGIEKFIEYIKCCVELSGQQLSKSEIGRLEVALIRIAGEYKEHKQNQQDLKKGNLLDTLHKKIANIWIENGYKYNFKESDVSSISKLANDILTANNLDLSQMENQIELIGDHGCCPCSIV